MKNEKLALFLLRLGIASVFLYAAIAATLEPSNWIGYLPQFLRSIFPAETLLHLFSAYQVGLSLWLLWGKKLLYPSVLSVLTFIAIIIANIGQLDIVFRDIAILFAALSLAVVSRDSK